MSVKDNFPTTRPSLLLDFANTKVLDPRITFSRASTATFYDGKTTAKAEENLLTYSQEFDNAAWNKVGVTITANSTTAPDGSSTADTLKANAGANSHLTQQLATTTASQTCIYSIFAKYSTAQYIAFGFASGALTTGWAFVTVDIQNGTITQTTNGGGGAITASGAIASVGNGWYRITVSGSYNQTNTYPTIHIVNTSTPSFGNYGVFSWTAAGTEEVYIWGAQLEQRSTVTAYTPTTTQPITNYIPVLQTAAANVARFDHNPVTGESLGLMVEEQRTNLLTYSDMFADAAWTKTDCSITANTIVAPDGTLTADKIVENSTTAIHFVSRTGTLTGNTVYATSVYVKAGERTRFQISGSGSTWGSAANATFDLATGSVVATTTWTSASITSVGNGWYRCAVIGTTSASPSSSQHTQFVLIASGTTQSYTGDGYSGIYIWGAQLEAGAFATSYIPTVASQVTRSADSASMTGTNFSSWYRADEGTIYSESSLFGVSNTVDQYIATILTDTVNNTIRLGYSGSFRRRFNVRINGVNTVVLDEAPNTTANTVYKQSARYAVNDFAISNNGSAVLTDVDSVLPQVGQLIFGGTAAHIRKFSYYPQRLTNEQLQALTQQG